jgi:hypothetical protein
MISKDLPQDKTGERVQAAHLSGRDTQADRLELRLSEHQEELSRLNAELAEQIEWGDVARQNLDRLALELLSLKSSASWRLTAPLRLLHGRWRSGLAWVKRSPRLVIRSIALTVREHFPSFYFKLAANPTVLRFYLRLKPRTSGPKPIPPRPTAPPAGSPAQLAAPPSTLRLGQRSTLGQIQHAMASWTAGHRLDS